MTKKIEFIARHVYSIFFTHFKIKLVCDDQTDKKCTCTRNYFLHSFRTVQMISRRIRQKPKKNND